MIDINFKNSKATHLIIIVVCVVAGVSAIRYTNAALSESEYRPMSQPLPGIGYTIGDTFDLVRGGRFIVEIVSPTTDQHKGIAARQKPPVRCDVTLLVRRSGSSWRQQSIAMFDNGGWTHYTDLYFADKPITLERGRYELILKRNGSHDPFTDHGAMVALVRFEAPGPEFGYFALELFGYAILIAGIAVAWLRHRDDPATNAP